MIDSSASGLGPTEGQARGDAPDRFPWRSFVLPAVLFVLVLAQTATVAVKVKAGSIYDEAAHFDYVVQLQKGNFPVPAGGRYSEEAIQAFACRPADKGMSIALLCGEPNSASDARLPFSGVNYEASYGPAYYALVAGGSSILSNVGVGDLTGARLASSLLYALGAALLLLVAQRLAFSSIAAAGVILAASSTGLALSLGATVTPDSMAFLVTAAVIASSLLSRTWRSAVLTTALVGVVAGLTKPNFILIAVLGSMLLLLRWVSLERPTPSWRTVRRFLTIGPAVALPVVLSAAGSFGWAALAASRNTTGLPSDGGLHLVTQSTLGPIERAAQQLSALLRPDTGTAFSVLDTNVLGTAGLVVVLVTLGACLGAWLYRIEADPRSVIVLRSVALAIPISAVVLVAIYWAAYQGTHAISPRFGIPFLGAASVGLGASIQRRAGIPVGLLGLTVWLCAWVGLVLQGYV